MVAIDRQNPWYIKKTYDCEHRRKGKDQADCFYRDKVGEKCRVDIGRKGKLDRQKKRQKIYGFERFHEQ